MGWLLPSGWRDITACLGLDGGEGSGEDSGGSWLGLGRLVGCWLEETGYAGPAGSGVLGSCCSRSDLGAPSWCNCSWSGDCLRSWHSGVSQCSRTRGFLATWVLLEAGPSVSSSLLDSYSDESSFRSWSGVCSRARVCSLARGAVAFLSGAAGFGFDGPGAAAGGLVKRPLGFLEVEMVPSLGEQVSPGVCSRPFNELGGVPVLQVRVGEGWSVLCRRSKVVLKSWSKNVTCSWVSRDSQREILRYYEDREEKRRWKSLQEI